MTAEIFEFNFCEMQPDQFNPASNATLRAIRLKPVPGGSLSSDFYAGIIFNRA